VSSLHSFLKWAGHNIAWLTICALFGVSCFLYATILEMRRSDEPYFAGKIERGEVINWNGHVYKEVKKK
jgi:hypothetical protein